MSEDNFNFIMHMVFMMLFTLIAILIRKNIATNDAIVDKISAICQKTGTECQVKTNSFWYVTFKKIVK